MKPNIQPTAHELIMRDDDIIVTKTDSKGRITYCNRTFIEFSGYTENELLGRQHNIVRHPDMPRAVFKLLWDTIQTGEEFNGYVKNLHKDGGFYWVFANITPSQDASGQLLGFYSVRRKPRPAALEIIIPLYQEMLAVEKQAGTRQGVEAASDILQARIEQQHTDYGRFIFSI